MDVYPNLQTIVLHYVIYEWSFRSDGQTYSTADQSLRLESKASFSNGRDVLGYYHSNQLSWSPQEIGFETQLRVYDQGDLVVFTQRFQVIENLWLAFRLCSACYYLNPIIASLLFSKSLYIRCAVSHFTEQNLRFGLVGSTENCPS